MVSRQSGQREILCAFGDGSDAALVAKAAGASMSDRARYSFMLDEIGRAETSQDSRPAGAASASRDSV